MTPTTTRRDRLGLLTAPAALAASALGGVVVLANVDVTDTSLLPPCPFLAITGLWCPFCGGTRALDALAAGDLSAALGLNLLVVVAVPLVVAEWLRWTTGRARGRQTSFMNVSTQTLAVVAAVVLVYSVVRNLPGLEALAPPS